MLSKKMSIYFLASVLGAFSSVSLADTEELILQKLLEKGVISDSEYQDALELKQVDEELTAKKAKKKAKKKKSVTSKSIYIFSGREELPNREGKNKIKNSREFAQNKELDPKT